MTADLSRIDALNEWVRDKEGESLEFKTARNRYDFSDPVEYCVALANEGGGKIILGVTDERPRQIVGTKAFNQPERTRKGLCERIPLGIDFEEINHPDCEPGSRVLVFTVPSGQGMNLIYEDLIEQSKPAPEFSRTDQYQVEGMGPAARWISRSEENT